MKKYNWALYMRPLRLWPQAYLLAITISLHHACTFRSERLALKHPGRSETRILRLFGYILQFSHGLKIV